jgi:hypothetical protein
MPNLASTSSSHNISPSIQISFFRAVSTFVPKKGIVLSAPKGVQALKSSGSMRSSMRNDIKMMPIGVPKVAYRVPGGQGAEW